MVAKDSLRFDKCRLNAFKGLASESYICLTSDDPILTAIMLKKRLLRTAEEEKHYRVNDFHHPTPSSSFAMMTSRNDSCGQGPVASLAFGLLVVQVPGLGANYCWTEAATRQTTTGPITELDPKPDPDSDPDQVQLG